MLSIRGLGTIQREVGRLLARSTFDGLDVELLTRLNDQLEEARAALRDGDETLATACMSRALRVVEESDDEASHDSGLGTTISECGAGCRERSASTPPAAGGNDPVEREDARGSATSGGTHGD